LILKVPLSLVSAVCMLSLMKEFAAAAASII
jgi:hypothetical protein